MKQRPYKYHGLWIYGYLPSGMRKAELADFFDEHKRLRLGLKFLVQCINTPEYEAHEITEEYENSLSRWVRHISAGHVFVLS